jgi:hypothetical protein
MRQFSRELRSSDTWSDPGRISEYGKFVSQWLGAKFLDQAVPTRRGSRKGCGNLNSLKRPK